VRSLIRGPRGSRLLRSGVNGGSFPSSGSTISDVDRSIDRDPTRSCCKCLDLPVAAERPLLCGSVSQFGDFLVCQKRFVARGIGLDSGVVVAYDHTPCRSGSPQAVRGIFQLLLFAVALAFASA